jgi:hypothetical protein
LQDSHVKDASLLGRALLFVVSFAFAVSGLAAQSERPQPAVPVEPITAIIDAFQSHDVIALGEGNHGNDQGLAFRVSLVRNRRFADTVNDIVVENGNALYQDAMDRFIRGEEVPDASLRRVWQNTTQPFTTFDGPASEEFFRAVRTVNLSLPRDRRLRVLLGDPPVDWDRIEASKDLGEWRNAMGQRDSHPATLLRREVLSMHRRALMIYGDMHFQRKNLTFNYENGDPRSHTIVNLLEDGAPRVKVFTVWTNASADLRTLQPDVEAWPKPSLTMVRGTVLGAADFSLYAPDDNRVVAKNDQFVPIPREQWRTLRMEDQVDAVLYLGSPSEITGRDLSPALCTDDAYMKMRLERFALVGLPQSAGDRLKGFCAKVAPK